MMGLHVIESKLRIRSFLGANFAGIIAGCVDAFALSLSADQYFAYAVLGAFFLVFAGYVGGFSGAYAAAFWSWVRRGKLVDMSTDGVLMFFCYGSFLGFIAGLLFSDWTVVRYWTAGGAFMGGFLAGMMNTSSALLFELAVADDSPEQAHKDARRRKAHERLDPSEPRKSKTRKGGSGM
ncbi:hypothetical protein LWC08_01015 [Desulfobaculum bizertense]|uniref:hypothetical protein n=1 Tax=Desulfobaculum bizertense TaxID=376490 RepID=UPI001F37DDDB|nr:hypothetical protein [Desulfobaculum bizertense]UIJ38171.1 hypothetical protein LWC08_01015 [Desulfobaculum bizertense]